MKGNSMTNLKKVLSTIMIVLMMLVIVGCEVNYSDDSDGNQYGVYRSNYNQEVTFYEDIYENTLMVFLTRDAGCTDTRFDITISYIDNGYRRYVHGRFENEWQINDGQLVTIRLYQNNIFIGESKIRYGYVTNILFDLQRRKR